MDAHDEEARIDHVEISGLVVLKLIQHCRDRLPELVTGQLLGLDRRDEAGASILEVTNCFPYFNQEDADDSGEAQIGGAEYQYEYMRCLREVNADYNAVGWYSSALMGSFLNESTIETQFKFQDSIKKSILLVYDPLRTSQGVLSLRAFRLSAAFIELYKTQTFTKESISRVGLSFDEIYQEIPVKIQNTHLANALLIELEDGVTADSEFDRLELSGTAYVEKHVEYVIDCLDDLSAEQGKFQYYQRNLQRQQAQQAALIQKRKAENLTRKANGEEPLPETDPNNPIFKPLPEPLRLDSLLIENHVDLFCDQINRFSSQSLAKLHLFSGLF